MPRFPDHFLDDIRARVPISTLIGPRVSFDRKKTNARRGDYWFCCPAHGEKNPSAHCEDAKGRWHCFGCGAGGNHFKFLMDIDGVDFPRAVEIVADLAGMPLPDARSPTEEEKAEAARRAKARAAADEKRRRDEDRDRERRTNNAVAIWKETLPFAGSLAEVYFNWRGLSDPKDENLRFHPALPYPKEFADVPGTHPTLIAKIAGPDGKGIAIWRIFLCSDGRGKLDVANPKLGLGPSGGGAVRIGGIARHIGLCEGIETSCAITGLGHTLPIWPATSTSGIIGFVIPEGVETVTVFPDRDYSKIRTRDDGKIKHPPGLVAYKKFKENNPGRDIRLAPGPTHDDYLETYQKLKGLPVR